MELEGEQGLVELEGEQGLMELEGEQERGGEQGLVVLGEQEREGEQELVELGEQERTGEQELMELGKQERTGEQELVELGEQEPEEHKERVLKFVPQLSHSPEQMFALKGRQWTPAHAAALELYFNTLNFSRLQETKCGHSTLNSNCRNK